MKTWLKAIAFMLAVSIVPVALSPSHAAAVSVMAAPHPRIVAAIKALTAAKDELQAAARDFGGHRADAVKAIDAALEQLNLALQFADK
jgi:hypothetical protein